MDAPKKGKTDTEKDHLFNTSCSRCRSRKQKCDGAQPTCGRCKDAGSTCEYTVRRPSGRASELYGRKTKRLLGDEERGKAKSKVVVTKRTTDGSSTISQAQFEKGVVSYFLDSSLRHQLSAAKFNYDGLTLSLCALNMTYLQLYPDSKFTTIAASRCWDELGVTSENFNQGWLLQPHQLSSIDINSHFRMLALMIQYGCAFTLGLTVLKMREQSMDLCDKTMQLIVYSTEFLPLVPPEESEKLVRHIVFLLHVVGICNDRPRGLRVLELAEKAMALSNYSGRLGASVRAFRNWVYPELVSVDTLEEIISRLDLTLTRPAVEGSAGGGSSDTNLSCDRIESIEDYRSKVMELAFTFFSFQPVPMTLEGFLSPLREIPIPPSSRSVMYRIAFDLCYYHYERMLKKATSPSQRDALAAVRNPVAAIVALSLYHQDRYEECVNVIANIFETVKDMTSPFLGILVPIALCSKVLFHMGRYNMLIRIMDWVCGLKGGFTPDRDGMVRNIFVKLMELPIIKQAYARVHGAIDPEVYLLQDGNVVVQNYSSLALPSLQPTIGVGQSVGTIEGMPSSGDETPGQSSINIPSKLSAVTGSFDLVPDVFANGNQYELPIQTNVEGAHAGVNIFVPLSAPMTMNQAVPYGGADLARSNLFLPQSSVQSYPKGQLKPDHISNLPNSMSTTLTHPIAINGTYGNCPNEGRPDASLQPDLAQVGIDYCGLSSDEDINFTQKIP